MNENEVIEQVVEEVANETAGNAKHVLTKGEAGIIGFICGIGAAKFVAFAAPKVVGYFNKKRDKKAEKVEKQTSEKAKEEAPEEAEAK